MLPERRAHPRHPADWLCKLRPEAGVRYAPGRVIDLSASGVLVELHSPRSIQRGDTVELLLDSARRVIVESREARSGRVVRVGPGGIGGCRVAIRFDREAADVAARAA